MRYTNIIHQRGAPKSDLLGPSSGERNASRQSIPEQYLKNAEKSNEIDLNFE
jgi:hypothetical protein